MEDNYFLNGLIVSLCIAVFISMIISVLRVKKFPFSISLIAVLIIILCFTDAILRFSFWPLGTAAVMVGVLVTAHITNNKIEVQEMIQRDREWREQNHIDEIRENLINRQFDKENE